MSTVKTYNFLGCQMISYQLIRAVIDRRYGNRVRRDLRRHYIALGAENRDAAILARKMIRRPGKLWKMAGRKRMDEDSYVKGGGGVGEP